MLIKVFCVLSMLNKLPPCRGVLEGGGGGGATGLLNKGGGSSRLVTKQQAVEFPQVQTSCYNYGYLSHFIFTVSASSCIIIAVHWSIYTQLIFTFFGAQQT